jgi:hypothetical protein
LPIASRIRVRLNLEPKTPQELVEYLDHVLSRAGNRQLLSSELKSILCEHAGGNYRTLSTMGAEMLTAAARQEARELDEKLFFELFAPPRKNRGRATSASSAAGLRGRS